jgi:DNA-binding NarL/FixJ family response regulator
MGLKMPGMNGIQATRLLHQRYPQVRVLVLTTYDADEPIFDAIRNGAAGYLLKGALREASIAAVRGTTEGDTHVDHLGRASCLPRSLQALPARIFRWLTR